MRAPAFENLLAVLVALATAIFFAPYIGLGRNEEFILYKVFGITRAEALDWLSLFVILTFVFHWRITILRAPLFAKLVVSLVVLMPFALLVPYIGLERILNEFIGINSGRIADWLILFTALAGICQIMTLDIASKDDEAPWIAAARATRRTGLCWTDPPISKNSDSVKRRELIGPVANIELYSIAFLVTLFVGFKNNLSCLYINRDGAFIENQLALQGIRHSLFSHYGPDPLQGNFDAVEPIYRDYILPDMLTTLFTGANPAKPTVFIIYAAIMVLSIYLLGRAIGIHRGISMLGAFVCPLLTLPSFIGFPTRVHGFYAFAPFVSQQMSFALLIIACFWKLDDLRFGRWLLLALAAALASLGAFLSAPWTIVITVPVTLFFVAASFFAVPGWSANISKLLTGVFIVCVLAILEIFQFAYVLYKYSATSFFSQEMVNDRLSLYFVSILYHGGLGPMIVITAIVGACYAVFTGNNRLRIFALAFLVYCMAFQSVALVINRLATNYIGPSPLYFEYLLWPLYSIFCAIVAFAVIRWLLVFLSLLLRTVSNRWLTVVSRYISDSNVAGHATLIITICVLGAENVRASIKQTDNCASFVFSYQPTKITEELQRETELRPGMRFRGLTATFTGYQNKPSVTFNDVDQYDRSLWREMQNEHRMTGLWRYGIPTLYQGSSFTTPAYYFYFSEYFMRAQDKQTRGALLMTQPNLLMLQSLGVRFVITDFDPQFGVLRMKLPRSNGPPLRLVELEHPNLGQYSPTEVIQVNSFHSASVSLHSALFDARRTVVTDSPLFSDLVKARDVELIFEKDGFLVNGKSADRSVIVLPVQYSHCWKISGSGHPFLFRANIMQLAIGFEGALDAALEFHFGPFSSPRCRFDDLKDMERLRMRSARFGRDKK